MIPIYIYIYIYVCVFIIIKIKLTIIIIKQLSDDYNSNRSISEHRFFKFDFNNDKLAMSLQTNIYIYVGFDG